MTGEEHLLVKVTGAPRTDVRVEVEGCRRAGEVAVRFLRSRLPAAPRRGEVVEDRLVDRMVQHVRKVAI